MNNQQPLHDLDQIFSAQSFAKSWDDLMARLTSKNLKLRKTHSTGARQ